MELGYNIPSGNLTWLMKITIFTVIGKPSINGPFSIAMLVYQRVFHPNTSWFRTKIPY